MGIVKRVKNNGISGTTFPSSGCCPDKRGAKTGALGGVTKNAGAENSNRVP